MEPVSLRAICSSEFSSAERSMSIGHTAPSWTSEPDMKNILAERYKTKFCRNYLETSTCPYGVRCMFAHGEHELRTKEMNLSDGLVTEDAIRKFQRHYSSLSFFPSMQTSLSSTAVLKPISGLPKIQAPYKMSFMAPPPYYNQKHCSCHHYCCCCHYCSYSSCGCGDGYQIPCFQKAPRRMKKMPSLIFYTHNPYNQCVLLPESRLYGDISSPSIISMLSNEDVESFDDMLCDDYVSNEKFKELKDNHFCVDDKVKQEGFIKEYNVDFNLRQNEDVNMQISLPIIDAPDMMCDTNNNKNNNGVYRNNKEEEGAYSACSSLGGVSGC